jgi:hypothetical protein
VLFLTAVAAAGCLSADPLDPSGSEAADSAPTPAGAMIHGAVMDENIVFVRDALVVVRSAAVLQQTMTDASGRYQISGLEPGLYRVQVTAACCRQYLAEVTLQPDEERMHNVRLELFDLEDFPYEESFHWEGFLACGLNYGNLGASCGNLDSNNERQLRFDVYPGLKTMLVAMDWTPNADSWGEELRFRVMRGDCNSNGNSCTYAHVRGPPALESAIDDRTGPSDYQFQNLTKEQRITVRVWPDGSPNLVYQQPFTMYFRLHYLAPAPEGATALPG